jgi:hypothetical protein
MPGETNFQRPDSPTSVALSNSDLKKLFATSSENNISHYATYNRLQAKELLSQLQQVRKAEKRSSSPPPTLKSSESVSDDDTDVSSTSSIAASPYPTLRKPTLKQNLHRMMLWPKYMLLNCLSNICEAVWIMSRDLWAHEFKPSKIFESNDPLGLSSVASFAGKKAPGYSCQLTFTKKFEDKERLENVLKQLCRDSGMPEGESMAAIRWNDGVELLNEFSPDVNNIPGDHYIPNSRSYYAEGSRFKKYHVGIDMYESEETTIMQAHLPGRAWDGTSCFNFAKELVHRYYSDDSEQETSPVFKANELIKMSDSAREQFDSLWNLFSWAVWVPYNVYSNQSGLCWQKASADAGVDGNKEIPKELCHANFSDSQSKKLSKALKKHATTVGSRGVVSPTAALVFAGVHAFKIELGELPFNVNMQASLQTRSFEPSFKERRFVGDWLIGVLHKVRTWGRLFRLQTYKVDDAQQFYQDLIEGLGTTDASIRDGLYSRVLGKLKGGAAAFEKTPCFPGNSRLNDSLFFNNYGIRTIHEDAGCVGFNWSGAGKVGINCILINGRICCSIASTQLPLVTVEAIRDTFKSILLAMMDGEDGDEAVKRIAEERMQ